MNLNIWESREFSKWEKKHKKTTPKEYGIMLSKKRRRGGNKKNKK